MAARSVDVEAVQKESLTAWCWVVEMVCAMDYLMVDGSASMTVVMKVVAMVAQSVVEKDGLWVEMKADWRAELSADEKAATMAAGME
jgi:hypothetical protein